MSTLSLLAPKTRIKAQAGDDIEAAYRFSSAGVPKDVTGSHLAQIRVAPEAPATLAAWAVDASRAVEGIVVLKLSSSVSQSLPVNTILAWDFQWTGPDAKVKTLLRGTLFLEADTSR